ncbi:MAG TPA: tetratricopeptide repeat protein [Nannocystaceae bacterium]|nr:tetratricopeptide repeat protein [Nannocystaceae bacterium]
MTDGLHRTLSDDLDDGPESRPEPRAALRPAEDFGARAEIANKLFGDEATPVMIGRFRVTRRLGEGGMGRVYAAIDAELDRRIAVKLLADPATSGSVARERMLREARSLAKLSHPHVVAIFDVGEHYGSIFLAMEFVDGMSLADWQRDAQPWRVVLDKYLQAGEGLAAVHDTGLVHRDFKPANVLIDAGGRVKIADFGVALAEASAETIPDGVRASEYDPAVSGSLRLTATGALLGTPLFMSPEQLRGRTVDTRSDQFSFCFALYDAVFGTPPFSIDQRRDRDLRLEPGTRSAPGWLRAVLQRGLALHPQDRWPDMPTLLRALRRGANRGRTFAILGGVVVGGSIVASASAWIATPSCEGAGTAIDRVWNDRRGEDVRAAFTATGMAYAATTAETVVSQMDGLAQEWSATRVDVCSDHQLWRARSMEFHDASMACLDRRLVDIGTLATQLDRIDAAGVQHAGSLVATLTPTRNCVDPQWLEQSTRYYEAPEAGELREQVVAAKLELTVGHLEPALRAAEALSERARELETERVRAEATGVRAAALEQLGRWDEAEATYVEAIRLADGSHHDELAVELWRGLVGMAAYREDFEAADHWLALLDGAVLRIGDAPAARAHYLVGRGLVAYGRADYAAAEESFRRALALFDEAGLSEEPAALETMRRLAGQLSNLGQTGAAVELYQRTVAITRARLGDGHPFIARLEFNLGLIDRDAERLAPALEHFERAIAIEEPIYGPESERLRSLYLVTADAKQRLGDAVGARPFAERAHRLSQRLPAHHSERAHATMVLARVEVFTGNPRPAIARFEELLALGIDDLARAQSERSLAILHCDLHDAAKASPHLERATALAPTDAHELREQIAVARARIERGCVD